MGFVPIIKDDVHDAAFVKQLASEAQRLFYHIELADEVLRREEERWFYGDELVKIRPYLDTRVVRASLADDFVLVINAGMTHERKAPSTYNVKDNLESVIKRAKHETELDMDNSGPKVWETRMILDIRQAFMPQEQDELETTIPMPNSIDSKPATDQEVVKIFHDLMVGVKNGRGRRGLILNIGYT